MLLFPDCAPAHQDDSVTVGGTFLLSKLRKPQPQRALGDTVFLSPAAGAS